jgi:E3 ubiquitin-protein ligase NEDD4
MYDYVCTACVQSPRGTEEGVRAPETGAIHGCEPPCGCWELNLGHLEEMPVFLTAEPSLQLPNV